MAAGLKKNSGLKPEKLHLKIVQLYIYIFI